MKVLALVTAKSNSTRVPHKNKAILHGKPLYTWTRDFIQDNSHFFADMCFSSDLINDWAVYDGWLGARRSDYLIADSTPHIESVRHAVHVCEGKSPHVYDAVMLFQPTNPYRTSKTLYHALTVSEKYISKCKNYMCRCIYLDKNMNKNYIVGARWMEKGTNEPPYIKSGNIYLYSREHVFAPDRLEYTNNIVIPKSQGYNINDGMDIRIVEAMMKEEGVPYGYQNSWAE